jgi:hypothetical protein
MLTNLALVPVGYERKQAKCERYYTKLNLKHTSPITVLTKAPDHGK